MKKISSQSLLESVLAFAAATAIIGAAMGIFGWGIAHIPARQATYEATRVLAGRSRGRNVDERGAHGGAYAVPVWPTYSTGAGLAAY
ncbi:MAG: hypothetical protein ABH872_00635 [Candidatus Omnitrophota bacterium]